MRIALATQRDLWPTEVDDLPLHDALRAAGAVVETPVWDDPDVEWAGYDLVVPRTTWDYVPKIQAFLDWIARVGAVTRMVNDPTVMRWNLDKSYLRHLEAMQVPCVPTRWVNGTHDIRMDPAWTPETVAFLKPAVGAGASGTLRFTADAAGLEQARRHVEGGGRFLLQPFQASIATEGERSAVVLGGQVSHAVQKLPPPGDYRVQDEHGGVDRPWRLQPDEAHFLELVLAALRRVAPGAVFARVDWLVDPRGRPMLCELELVEPSLFFRHDPRAAVRLANLLIGACARGAAPS